LKVYCDSDAIFVPSKWDDSSVIDPEGNKTSFEYDGNRRLTKRIRRVIRTGERNKPVLANQVTRFFYDEADRLIREETDLLALSNGTNKGKLVTELTYDQLDRVSRKVIKEEYMGEVTIKDDSNFTYSRQLDVTRLASANNQTVNLSFDYEDIPPFSITNYSVAAADVTNPLSLIEGNFTVTPHTTGEIGAISKDGSQIYTKSYDAAGRLTGVNSNFAGQSYAAIIIRDALGRKTNVNHSTGLNGTYDYDVLNRVTGISCIGAGENFSQSISYNSLTGNIDQIIREIGTFTYGHDELEQLTGVNFSGTESLGPLVENRSINYDKNKNRVDDSFFGETLNSRNTILSNEQWTYYTDRNGLGDIIQKSNANEAHLFEYRGDKRLQKYTHIQNGIETNNTEYYFDALGRRVAKDIQTPIDTFTHTFVYEADTSSILLAKKGNGEEKLYIDGNQENERLAEIGADGVKPYIVDHLGTVLNSAVNNEKRATGAFGELLGAKPILNSSSDAVNYGFIGAEYDIESNSHFIEARQYDQDSARFFAQDPALVTGTGENPYDYALANPLLYVDRNGENPYCCRCSFRNIDSSWSRNSDRCYNWNCSNSSCYRKLENNNRGIL
jgi:RHS repeat-associated protein